MCQQQTITLYMSLNRSFLLVSVWVIIMSCVLWWVTCVHLFMTLWIVTCQSPLSIGFCRQEYWSEWVAVPLSRRSYRPRDPIQVSCVVGRFFITVPPGEPWVTITAQQITNNVASENSTCLLFQGFFGSAIWAWFMWIILWFHGCVQACRVSAGTGVASET